MKYHRNVFTYFKVDITIPMCCTSVFSSDMTIISDLLSKSIILPQIQQKCFKMLYHLFTIIIFFKIELISLKTAFFSSVQHKILTKIIINTNTFISKTTRNIVLIFFCIRKAFIINTNINTF